MADDPLELIAVEVSAKLDQLDSQMQGAARIVDVNAQRITQSVQKTERQIVASSDNAGQAMERTGGASHQMAMQFSQMILSIAALLLARFIAPPSLEKMTREQEWALTGLLLLILFLAVTGEMPFLGSGEPMAAGMAVVWGIGLGLSGMLVVRLLRERVIAMLKAALGSSEKDG